MRLRAREQLIQGIVMQLTYVPSGPRSQNVRIVVNNHIRRYAKRRSQRKNVKSTLKSSDRSAKTSETPSAQSGNHELAFSQRNNHARIQQVQSSYWQLLSVKLTLGGEQNDLKYALEIFWPGFDPGGSTVSSPFASNAWILEAVHDETLLYSFLWASSVHLFAAQRSATVEARMNQYHQQLVRSLIEDMKTEKTGTRDAVLLAVLSLHPDGAPPGEEVARSRSGFDPPYSQLQSVGLYSQAPYSKTHVTALMRLVNMRGGLDTLHLPGLRPLLQYTDLLRASMVPEAPAWPLCVEYRAFETAYRRLELITDPMSTLLHHHGLQELLDHDMHPLIWDAFLNARAYLEVLNRSFHHISQNESLSRLVIHRNVLQHRILSTLDIIDDLVSVVSQVMRQALLVFTLGVMFPVSYAPTLRAATHELKTLYQSFEHRREHNLADFSLWICMVGALGAKTAVDATASFFICELARIEGKRSVTSDFPTMLWNEPRTYMEISQVFQDYLWLEQACGKSAAAIWEVLF